VVRVPPRKVCQAKMAADRICGEPYIGSDDRLCIFHSSNLHWKEEEGFRQRLKERIETALRDNNVQEVDLTGYIFPSYDFSGMEFKKSLILQKAEFQQGVSFKGCKFSGSWTDFSGAIFQGERVDFSGANFAGDRIEFSKAQFKSQHTIFRDSIFANHGTYFLQTHFSGRSVFFDGAAFDTDYTSFSEAHFEVHLLVDFSGAKFVREQAVFKGTSFVGITLFRHAHFAGKSVDFAFAKFEGDETTFHGARFQTQITGFLKAVFMGQKTDFDGAEFEGTATDFRDARFKAQQTNFNGTRFEAKKTYFLGAHFEGQSTLFLYSHFREWTDFREVQFGGHISFKHTTLSQVQFGGTDLREVRFLDVQWCTLPKKRFLVLPWPARNALFDEAVIRGIFKVPGSPMRMKLPMRITGANRSELELVCSAYRQLKQNYEDNRNYTEAGDFYYGEMEMTRLKLPFLRRYLFSWEALYWIVSGYGQRWENSFILLVLTFLVFPIFFMFGGLQTPTEDGLAGKYISYDIAWNLPPVSQALADYELCVRYSTVTILPMKESSAHFSPSIVTRYLLVAEIILLPTFATLFILALRRRFKR
jgi:uncharacterized protein YjbI with pentapeptide repeats